MPNYVGSSWYGTQTGTSYSYSTQGYITPVTKIEAWADSAYVYGLKLGWASTSTDHMFGTTREGTYVDPYLDTEGETIQKIRVYVDGFTILRGIIFWQDPSLGSYQVGFFPSGTTVYNDTDYAFTNMECYTNTLGGIETMIAIKFYYTDGTYSFAGLGGTSVVDPRTSLSVAELGWPALSALAHTAVVASSMMKVGKLRSRLGIQAPSCDPSLTTSPSDTQLWYRTFRAQENCKEVFLVYLPSILIASTLGYQVFGKWAPRVVGALALTGAFFRYKYLNSYVENADADVEKREKPFSYASACMKPIFVLAVVSSGYMVGKELYHAAIRHHKKILNGSSSSSEEEEEEDRHYRRHQKKKVMMANKKEEGKMMTNKKEEEKKIND